MAKTKVVREVAETSAEFAKKAYDEILDFFGYGADAEEIMSEADKLSPQTRNVLKALERDDFLGFETPDQALKQYIEDPVYTIMNYDLSPQLKGSLTKFANNPPSKPKKTMADVAPRIGGTEKLSTGAEYDLSNAQKTQVATTGGSYQKARGLLDQLGVGNDVLDYGAGRGHGTEILGGKSYEPFPNNWTPDFTGLTPPDQQFEGVVNMNVLNVLPPEKRMEVAQGILNSIKPDGYGIVGARSYPDVMSAKTKELLPDGGVMTGRGTYQYGFGGQNEGLVDFLNRAAEGIPDKQFDIKKENIAATGALIKRLKAVGGLGILGQMLADEQDKGMY